MPVRNSCEPGALPENPSFSDIVRDYRRRHQQNADDERATFLDCPSLGLAIEYAGSAENGNGRRFDHQRRITSAAINESLPTLRRAIKQIEKCTTFSELHKLLEELLTPIHGIGKLYVYDTSARLGTKLGLQPDRIYLHAGTRVGAKNLGLDVRRGSVAVDELPSQLRDLTAGELEDLLCIYKDHLKGAMTRAKR